jgi:hypothetical protein
VANVVTEAKGDKLWHERLTVVGQLVLFAAGIALVMLVVMGSLNFLASECERGTPRLTWYFNCFPQR